MPETGSSNILFTSRCALVPEQFFEPSSARAMLVETADVPEEYGVSSVPVPWYGAVLIYAHPQGSEALPELYRLLEMAAALQDHNRIAAAYRDGVLYLVVAEDSELRLCNSFQAMDFTTAEYFLFMALGKLQINPEMSAVYFDAPLDSEQEMSLYRYFKSVEKP